jgi:hypothetical protein
VIGMMKLPSLEPFSGRFSALKIRLVRLLIASGP